MSRLAWRDKCTGRMGNPKLGVLVSTCVEQSNRFRYAEWFVPESFLFLTCDWNSLSLPGTRKIPPMGREPHAMGCLPCQTHYSESQGMFWNRDPKSVLRTLSRSSLATRQIGRKNTLERNADVMVG